MSETPVQVGQKLSAQSGSSSVFPSMFPTSPYPQTVGSNKAMRFRKRGTELLKAGSTYHEFGKSLVMWETLSVQLLLPHVGWW